MQSRLLKKLGATAPVLNKPSGQMSYEEALANMSGGMSYEEADAVLFPTDAEEEAAIAQAILEDDRGESIPWEQAKAELDSQIESLVAAAKRRLRNKKSMFTSPNESGNRGLG